MATTDFGIETMNGFVGWWSVLWVAGALVCVPAWAHPEIDTQIADVTARIEREPDDASLLIRRGASFHGMALNVDVDLEPFSRINPCGFTNLEVTDLARLGAESDLGRVRQKLLPLLLGHMGFTDVATTPGPDELPRFNAD